jgi:TRAP transporter TAXI family solute receptor
MSESKPASKSVKPRGFGQLLQIYGLGLIAVIAAFVLAYQFVEPAPPSTLTIATGRSDGAYYAVARRYRELLAESGIELKILETAGSVENLQLLQSGAVDVAFVQGGTASKDMDLRALGSLYFEPMWLFVRRDIAGDRLDALAGKRVAWGGDGSGTQAVARLLFAETGVAVEGLPLSGDEARAAFEAGEVDAVLTIAGYNAGSVQRLLQVESARLLSLARAEAISRRYDFLSALTLPAGLLSLRDNLPPQNVQLVAPAASLAIQPELHPALATLLLMTAARIHGDTAVLAPRGTFPSEAWVEFPLTPEAQRYFKRGPPFLQRYLPFWAAVLFDRLWVMLLPVIGLMIPLSRILPPTYRWRVRKRVYRWYEQLEALEARALASKLDAEVADCLRELDEIEAEVQAVEVPLSYASELYLLRQHIELLRQQFVRRAAGFRERDSRVG